MLNLYPLNPERRALSFRESVSHKMYDYFKGTLASLKPDAAVIDSLMAAAMVGEGTGYANLTYTCGLNSEEYGVGFRKGSDLVQKLNDFFKASYADGSMLKIAETYGVQAAVIEQK